MERKIIYLINPISGAIKKEGIINLIEKETTKAGIAFEIVSTNIDGDYSIIKEKISKEKITDVIIVGGDGSVNHVTGALYDTKVRFGIIPLGSGNGLAFTAGIPSNPKKAMTRIFSGETILVDAFKINGHFACMLSGLGFDAQVAHDFAKGSSRGLLTYIRQSTINYIKAKPYCFEIIVNNIAFKSNALFISIANSNQFGNNITIAPKASLNDGLLDVIIVNKMNKVLMSLFLVQQIAGKNKLHLNDHRPDS